MSIEDRTGHCHATKRFHWRNEAVALRMSIHLAPLYKRRLTERAERANISMMSAQYAIGVSPSATTCQVPEEFA